MSTASRQNAEMNTAIKSLWAVILCGGLFIGGCADRQRTSFQSLENPDLAAHLKSFELGEINTAIKSLWAVILCGGLFIGGCADRQRTSFQSLENPDLAAHLKSFVAEKEAQANAATNKMPSDFQAFFAVAAKG